MSETIKFLSTNTNHNLIINYKNYGNDFLDVKATLLYRIDFLTVGLLNVIIASDVIFQLFAAAGQYYEKITCQCECYQFKIS